jgi:glycosyltransferase involved in cell wall biosynthesis
LRILFLIRALSIGGAERQLALVADGLAAKGHTVTVATFYNEAGITLHQATHVVLHKQSRWDVWGFLKSLLTLIRQEKPDVLHGYLTVSNILVCLLKLFSPRLRVVMGLRASNMHWRTYGVLPAFLAWLEAKTSHLAHGIIANSQAGLAYARQKGFKGSRLVCIENGIDTQLFRPNLTTREAFRASHGFGMQHQLIALVGRLDPMKGHRIFLEACSLLKHTIPGARFIIMGSGDTTYKKELEVLAAQLALTDVLYFLPSQNPVPYSAFDVLCSPSLFGEGFPNVVAEAMSSGVPCVVTPVGDSPRIVGSCGLVVPVHDPHALADGITQILNHYSNYADGCRPFIEANFSVEALIHKTEAFLKGLTRA